MTTSITLGSKVRDVVSGFEGIVTARYEFLYGCTRYNVQPRVGDDGKGAEPQCFDEPQLELIESGVVKRGGHPENGGPPPSRPSSKDPR